jgi:dihydroorotate dehydrogenase (NAD+) catalytic subunit
LRVFQASKVTNIPIIGMGGISDHRDALKFIMAGATCVGVGTANYSNSNAMSDIVNELGAYLISNNLKNLDQIRSIL